jgi:hypothetical protein
MSFESILYEHLFASGNRRRNTVPYSTGEQSGILLGAIAPDVRYVAGIRRSQTHLSLMFLGIRMGKIHDRLATSRCCWLFHKLHARILGHAKG